MTNSYGFVSFLSPLGKNNWGKKKKSLTNAEFLIDYTEI